MIPLSRGVWTPMILKLGVESAPPTLEASVANQLRQAIFQGDLSPGEKLDEKAIADALKVSRTPVRAALRILATEGLVTVYPHRGAVVAELTLEEHEENYFIRGLLEGTAALLAAPKMDDERIAALRAVLKEFGGTTDRDEWMEINDRFHTTIYEAANRPLLLSLIGNLRNAAAPYIRQFIAGPKHTESSYADHVRILKACENRDGLLAQQEIQKHLAAVGEAFLEYAESSLVSR